MFLKISGFKDNFLGCGFTSAVLRNDGNISEVREVLTISVITGKSSGRKLLIKNLVGRGSRIHDAVDVVWMIVSISV